MSRIKKTTPTGIYFDAAIRDSLQDVVKKMQRTEDLKTVIIKFKKSSAVFIDKHKYYHGLVSEKVSGDFVEMSFLTSSFPFFSHWILSLPDKVDIISPAELKIMVKKQAEKAWNYYCAE